MNFHHLAVFKHSACIEQSGLDVLSAELGIAPGNSIPGVSGRDLVQNDRDRDQYLFDEFVVGSMTAYPKPRGRVAFVYTQCSITNGNSNRPYMGFRFNTFKSERRMKGIFFPVFKGLLGGLANGIWQLAIALPK